MKIDASLRNLEIFYGWRWYNKLEDSCSITLANPKYIKNIPGKKTNKRDSLWIADLHKYGLVQGSILRHALCLIFKIFDKIIACLSFLHQNLYPYFKKRFVPIKEQTSFYFLL